jgi:hypothetical protein
MSRVTRRIVVRTTIVLAFASSAVYGFSQSLESPMDVAISPFLLLTSQRTVYAAQYSDQAFRRLSPGMGTTDVERLLGSPLGQTWIYDCAIVWVKDNRIVSLGNPSCPWPTGKPASVDQLLKMRGDPHRMIWDYSASPNESSYHRRRVYFDQMRVEKTEATVYFD